MAMQCRLHMCILTFASSHMYLMKVSNEAVQSQLFKQFSLSHNLRCAGCFSWPIAGRVTVQHV